MLETCRTLTPSSNILIMPHIQAIRGNSPLIPESCWLAPSSTVVGEVTLGEQCTVWFNAVIRGDVNAITIGARTNIQDGACIHCTYEKAATNIGNDVSIGHHAIVHGCTVCDGVLIGMGAIVMDHAVIGEGCIIAAGAIVLERTVCEPGWLYAGVPAKPIKQVSEAQRAAQLQTAQNYVMYAQWFQEGHETGEGALKNE
jgi:carbonic anhydrase/acetyltransferase-like protein (isoleucine patch superfamily)